MNPLQIGEQQMLDWISQFLWPLFRISGFFMVVPIFGTQLVPARIRLGLALGTTLVVAPLVTVPSELDLLSLPAVYVTTIEVLTGLTLGFFMQFVFQLFIIAGQTMAMQMGLGFASMNDPANGVSVAVLSQFFLILVTLLFLSMNGHVVMIMTFVESFRVMPVGGPGISGEIIWMMAGMGGWMFATALMLALPVVTALLAVNLAFGIMNRTAQQLNIFTIGFPMTMVLGLVIVWISLIGFLPRYEEIVRNGFGLMRQVIGIP